MATKKKTSESAEDQVSLVSTDPSVKKPRLAKLIVKNFRCIGSRPVEIDLNDIVVLVGPNNAGKSSILKAYEVAMSQGSAKADLAIEDFPNNTVDPNNLPEIEVHTVVFEKTPGDQWIDSASGEMLIKERWVWSAVGKPKRQGWDTTIPGWSDKVPWGAPNVANTGRPEPHRVGAFDQPEDQADAIKKLLKQALEERVKNYKTKDDEESDYKKLLESVRILQKKIVGEAQDQIDAINKELTSMIEKIFPTYKIDFDAKPEDNLEKTINLFKEDPQLLMGPATGHLTTIDRQGSGARRTLLWTALKFISENSSKKDGEISSRPHLLLIDEPEICLHPTAIRDACDVLYDLPKTGKWQVMVTTHSPIFIDFSRDNTTIVRVEREKNGEVKGTTVFRPDKVKLDDDDRSNLKLLNLCDPYVAEFFFGGKTIIVEGDTEYTAFKHIIAKKPQDFSDIHIIRARGKATVVSLIKILNHFGANYSVLHDSDTPTAMTKNGVIKNPAWTMNEKILNEINNHPGKIKVRLLASLVNFEKAYFGKEVGEDKPYNALKKLDTETAKFETVESLLMALTDFQVAVPTFCTEWNNIQELEKMVSEMKF